MNRSSKEPTISIQDIKKRISSGDLEAERLMGLILLDGSGVKKNVNEGFRLLRESAEHGDSTSECDVGFCYHTGQGTDFNCSEAVRYYKLSADHYNAKGHNNLGYCLFNGEGTRSDQKQAAMHFKISSDNNCPEGICNYARCLEYGDGVPQDLTKAAELYKKAADLNNSHAMYCYGRCLANGIGVQKNDQKAVEYFKRASDRHDEYGQLYYNLMLFKGRGIQRDEVAAVNFFQREALAGNPHCQTYYGIALETGRGVSQVDINKASMQYRNAANNGDPHGQFCLGMLFRDGKGVSKSEAEAARLFKQAADNGYGKAMVVFANCLNDGVGVTQFKPGAVSYYKAAAEKGKYVGQYKYGEFLEEGKFVEQNFSLAAHYYKLASDQHYAEAEYALGRLHETGKGVKLDYNQAASLYKRSSDQRLDKAEDRYGKCLQRGRGITKNPNMGVDYFRRSASQKYAPAQYHLGRSYETGVGIPSGPDLSIAVNNYKLAATQNHPQALYHLGLLYKTGVKMNLNPNLSTNKNENNSLAKYGKESCRTYKYPYETVTNFMNQNSGKETEDKKADDSTARIILEKDAKEAVKLFRTAAIQGHAKSLYEYGLSLLYGVGIEKDVEDAKNQFKMAAANGHSESMFILHLIAKEVDKDDDEMMKWLRNASDHNHAVSQCELAKISYSEKSDQISPEIIELFTKSAAAGYAEAYYWIGRLIEEGNDVTDKSNSISSTLAVNNPISPVISPSSNLPVEQKAFICYNLAAKESHILATTRVGLYQLNGLGTEVSTASALEMLKKAANLGDFHAYYYLGRYYEFGEGSANEQPANSLSNATPANPATRSTTNVSIAEKTTTTKGTANAEKTATKGTANAEKTATARGTANAEKTAATQMKHITKVKSTASVNLNPTATPSSKNASRNPRMNHLSQQGSRSSSNASNVRPSMSASIPQLPPMNDWVSYYQKAADSKDASALCSLGLLYARGTLSVTSVDGHGGQMEKAAALFAESASLGSACGKYCYSCCIARGEGGVDKDMELALQVAGESRSKGIHWTKLGKSPFEFEDEDSFTRFLSERKNPVQTQPPSVSLKTKDLNLRVNLASSLLKDDESDALESLEDAAKKGHQGAMFILASSEKFANDQQGEKFLVDAAPWVKKAVKVTPPEPKKHKPSLKKVQMTKKSITAHHKALIQKPDGKHTYILV